MKRAALCLVLAACSKHQRESVPVAASPPTTQAPADAAIADATVAAAPPVDASLPHDWYCIDVGKGESICQPSLDDCRSTLDENPGLRGHSCARARRVFCIYMDWGEGDRRHSCMRSREACASLFQSMVDHPSDFFSPEDCVEEISR